MGHLNNVPPEPIQPVDTLLHVADLHFWEVVRNPFKLMNKRLLGNLNVYLRRRHEFVMERADAFAERLAETAINTALLTGDFTSTSTEREFAMAEDFVSGLTKRGMDVMLVPGNHDVYTFGSHRRQRFEHHFRRFLPEKGYPAQYTLTGGTSVILVSTVRPNFLSSKGWIPDGDIQRMSAMLEKASNPVIVGGHYPVLHRTAQYETTPSRQLENAGALREALGRCGKQVLYVCGHVHRFSLVVDPEYPTLTHLSTGAFFRNDPEAGREGEFSEIHVVPDGFQVFRHVYEEKWLRRSH
jgi:predicted phosphodiesterase